jgi:hypothetical protein
MMSLGGFPPSVATPLAAALVALTLYQVSEMLSLSRVETEDYWGQHHVPLSTIG